MKNETSQDIPENVKISEEDKQMLGCNAWHLARFIIEHDHMYDIPKEIHMGEFVLLAEKYPDLEDDAKKKFINQYALIEKLAKNVTARTLAATRIHGKGFFAAAFGTSVGQYLIFLTSVAILFSFLLFNTDNDSFISQPFFAAGLGTCVYLLRVTQEKLRSREFDPAFIPSHLIRLGLGILIGGSSVFLFPDIIAYVNIGDLNNSIDANMSDTYKESLTQVNNYGVNAIAFILGYAVEIFYVILDKIGGNITRGTKK